MCFKILLHSSFTASTQLAIQALWPASIPPFETSHADTFTHSNDTNNPHACTFPIFRLYGPAHMRWLVVGAHSPSTKCWAGGSNLHDSSYIWSGPLQLSLEMSHIRKFLNWFCDVPVGCHSLGDGYFFQIRYCGCGCSSGLIAVKWGHLRMWLSGVNNNTSVKLACFPLFAAMTSGNPTFGRD